MTNSYLQNVQTNLECDSG